jgi:hypothetical protein
LEEIMGMSDRRMRQVLRVLNLPTELLFLADRYELSSRVLEEIVTQPEELWGELVDLAVHQGWTGEDLATVAREDEIPREKPARRKPSRKDVYRKAFSGIKNFSRTLLGSAEDPRAIIGQVADEVATSKESLRTYNFLVNLTEQLRLRLIEKGEIED